MGKYPPRKAVEDLNLPPEAIDLMEDKGFERLYPPQSKAADSILAGDSCVFAYPTASGKTLLGYLAIVKQVLENNGKALYIVPLRALASEKEQELKMFESLGISSVVSMGDYDEVDPSLKEHDVIVATSEKADSLLRHNVDWIEELDVIISDEVHLVNERGRGPTLEVTLSKLKEANPQAQMIALSATIANSEDIAKWLDAKHFESDWRPVELRKAVFFDNELHYESGHIEDVKDEGGRLASLVLPTLDDDDQCLIFVSSRRSTSATADKLKSKVSKKLTENEKRKLSNLAAELRQEADTSLGYELAKCVEKGTAFHHAGLNNRQRTLIEDNFRKKLIKVISATPTLAAGVNVPAHRVIIRDCKRYDGNAGKQVPLPVLEVQQMIGRAGRPAYDDEGEAILIAKNDEDVDEYLDRYILGESEKILSRLGNMTALRPHILALVATGYAKDTQTIIDFLEHTFYAEHHDPEEIKNDVRNIISYLDKENLINMHGKFKQTNTLEATTLGEKVSDLYIDPYSAVKMKNAFKYRRKYDVDVSYFSYIHVICHTPDMRKQYLKKQEKRRYGAEVEGKVDEFLQDIPADPNDYLEFMKAYKTALILQDWINEHDEDDLNAKYGVQPGDVYGMVSTAKWLTNAMTQLASLMGVDDYGVVKKLGTRLKHGVRTELLDLTRMRDVGRVRARSLYNSGYETVEAVKNTKPSKLEEVDNIGSELAESLSSLKRTKGAANITSDQESPSKTQQTSLQNF